MRALDDVVHDAHKTPEAAAKNYCVRKSDEIQRIGSECDEECDGGFDLDEEEIDEKRTDSDKKYMSPD